MYAERIAGLKSSAIREILKVTAQPGMISFAGGLPASELFPLAEIAAISGEILGRLESAVLQYSVTEGIAPLREKVARMLDPTGARVTAENVLITHGSQQGLDLLSKLYIDRGTRVLTENPSYLGAIQSFQLFQADIRPLPTDGSGLIPEQLDAACGSMGGLLLYLMPNFQNPTGITLSLARREKIVDIARSRSLIVVEDDPYGELVFEGERIPSLMELDGPGNIIRLGSFSKTIAPGLRIAYVAADSETIHQLAVIKQGTDLQTNTFGQHVVNAYLESGNYDSHIELIRRTYGARRTAMLAAMERFFPKSVSWNRPNGGMFLWVTLPESCDARDLLVRCLDQKVAFVPGQEFFPDGSGKNTIRLNYSNAGPETIEEGIRRMGTIMAGMGM